MEDQPKPVTKKCHETISDQMNNSFCIINEKEIGIFIHIKDENKDIYAIIINNIIKNEDYKDTKIVKVNGKHKMIEFEDIIYINEEDEISIIKLKQKYNEINYIEIDDKLNEGEIYYNKESIYTINYNDINNIFISYGVIKEIINNKLIYTGNINTKYKLSPIFLYNNKLIGIHKSGNKYIKRGIFLKRNINEFIKRVKYPYNIKYKFYKNINEINLITKIEKEDINKEIYFLDNKYIEFENDILIQHNEHDNLKELNELNTELYINKKQYEYKKYFKPEKEGEYKINIKFNIDLVDCSGMFAGCKNIINIKFKSFNTKNVMNMKYIFYDCTKLNNILNIFKWDTKNVTDMSGMFGLCITLNNLLDISKWDTKNVTNMSYMFYCCESLNNLPDISKWDTKNVTDMRWMFDGCNSLKSLPDISKWDTKNVTDMRWMFNKCESLKSLPDISKWDTKNITNMSGMFSYCKSLNNLPDISKWDTKNVTGMRWMFDGCNEKIIPKKFKNK